MSDRLKAFLHAYIEWVESGAPESDVFERFAGLCANSRWWQQNQGLSGVNLEMELQTHFEIDGLDPDYPFGGQRDYEKEARDDVTHLNEQRLAWVRSKVGQVAEA
jgi:hypothetical protein